MLKFFTYTTLISILVGAAIALETYPSTVADVGAEAPGAEGLNWENFALDSNSVDSADFELQGADPSRKSSVSGDGDWGQSGAGAAGSGAREAAGDRPQDLVEPTGTVLPVPSAPPAPPAATPGIANPALIPWGTPLGQTGSNSADSPGSASSPSSPAPQPAEISPPSLGVDPPPPRSLPATSAAPPPIAPHPTLASFNKPLPVQLSSEAASSRFLSPPGPSEFSPEQPPIPALW
ncbi:MAG: hypothetical protein ACO34J_05765 [Prochlorothrix sp.]